MLNYTVKDFYDEAQKSLIGLTKEELAQKRDEILCKYKKRLNNHCFLPAITDVYYKKSDLKTLDRSSISTISDNNFVKFALDLASLGIINDLINKIPLIPHKETAILIDISGSMEDKVSKKSVSTLDELVSYKPLKYGKDSINSIATNLSKGAEIVMREETVQLKVYSTDIFLFSTEGYNWGMGNTETCLSHNSTYIVDSLKLLYQLGYKNIIIISDGEASDVPLNTNLIKWRENEDDINTYEAFQVIEDLISNNVKISPLYLANADEESINQMRYTMFSEAGNDIASIISTIRKEEEKAIKRLPNMLNLSFIYGFFHMLANYTGGITRFNDKGKKNLYLVEENREEIAGLAIRVLSFIALAMKLAEKSPKFNLTNFLNARR